MKKKGVIAIVSLLILALVVVAVWGVNKYLNMKAERESVEMAEQRENAIVSTLEKLGKRTATGSQDITTVNYSTALEALRGAYIDDYIGNYANSGYKGTKKEYYFSSLNSHVRHNGSLFSATLLMFAYDYLKAEDVTRLANSEKVSANELKKEFIAVLEGKQISMNSVLISKKDREICNNMSLRIYLAEDGCTSVDEVYSVLKRFVCEGEALTTMNEDILAMGVQRTYVSEHMDACFTGEKVYFHDLTTSGKLFFLYMMPRYLCSCSDYGQDMGSILWYDNCEKLFDEIWQGMMSDEKLASIIE